MLRTPTPPTSASAATNRGAIWQISGPLLFGGVALAYLVGAELALRTLQASGFQAVFYLPAGVTVAALLRTPRRQWWIVLAAAAVVEATRDSLTGSWSGWTVLGYVLANTVEPLIGASLTLRGGGPIDLARRRHVAAFLLGAVLVGPAVGGGIGALTNRAFEGGTLWPTWWQWWLGDAAGAALVGIAVLAWGSSPSHKRLTARWTTGLVALSALSTLVAFAAWDLPMAFLVLVVVVLAAASFGCRGVALTSSAIACSVAANLLRAGRYGSADLPGTPGLPDTTGATSLLFVKAELVVFAFAGLWVAAESFDREQLARTTAQLRRRVETTRRISAALMQRNQALRDYRLLFDQAIDGVFIADDEGRFLDVNRAGCTLLGYSNAELRGRRVADIAVQHEGWLPIDDAEQWPGGRNRRRWSIARKDGSVFLGDVVARQLADGRVQGVLRDVTEEAQLAMALEASHEQLHTREAELRSLFSSIDEGFCVCELVLDEQGAAVDYRFIEVNPLFEEMTGLADAAGRTALELVADLEPEWMATYAKVALGGETLRFEQGSEAMGRWFDVFATPLATPLRFAIVFRDQTERRRAEEAMRASARLDGFRAGLMDALRVLDDPVEVQREAARRLGEHLGAARVHFTTVDQAERYGTVHADYHGALSSVVGRHRFDDFGSALMACFRRGEPVVVHDVDGDTRLNRAEREATAAFEIGAYVMVPVRNASRTEALLVVHHTEAHHWSDDELTVVRDTAERAWAMVQRAMAERELRQRHQRAELSATILSGMERVQGVQAKAQHLVDALVPAFADHAVVEQPSGEPMLACAAASGESHRGHSRLTVPVELGRGVRGSLRVGLSDPTRPAYGAGDRTYLQELAQRVGVALSAEQLRRDEHDIAVRLQRAMLPEQVVWHPNLSIEARYEAASDLLEIGGDWYDTFSWPDGRVGVLVGDVVGHNLESATLMGHLRAATAALATSTEPSPAALLEALDRAARADDASRFATAVCVIVDPSTGALAYSSAGHPPVLVLGPDGQFVHLDAATAPPLCVGPLGRRPEATTVLEPGALVLLYTDGIIERRRADLDVGLARLQRLLQSLAGEQTGTIAERILGGMAADSPPEDDMALACFRFTPPVATFRHALTAGAAALREFRRELSAWLAEHRVSEARRVDVLLGINEACANALEHGLAGRTDGVVDIEVTSHGFHVIAEVRDNGRWRTPRREEHRGRGTDIMRQLSTRFTRHADFNGTTVTMTFPAGDSAVAQEDGDR